MPQHIFAARLATLAAPALLLLSGVALAAESAPAAPAPASATPVPAPATKAELGYSIGLGFGAQLHSVGMDQVDLDAVMKGLKAGIDGTAPDNADQQRVMAAVREAQTALGAKNYAEANAFLEKNGKEPGVIATASGLQYRVLNAGDAKAASPKATDQVTVNYSGKLMDDTEFDSSYKRGQPATFGVGQVIKGWTEALQLMKPGAKYQLFIPPQLAYGDSPPPRSPIKPGSLLKFDVELLKVSAPTPTEAAAVKPKVGAAIVKKPATGKSKPAHASTAASAPK